MASGSHLVFKDTDPAGIHASECWELGEVGPWRGSPPDPQSSETSLSPMTANPASETTAGA